jgi:hypothetical protein
MDVQHKSDMRTVGTEEEVQTDPEQKERIMLSGLVTE